MLLSSVVAALGVSSSVYSARLPTSTPTTIRMGPRQFLGRLVRPASREQEPAAASPFDPARAKDTFEFFDADSSGFIDAYELHSALRHYGVDVTENGAQAVLKHYDTNPDGRLDQSEFAEIVRDAARGLVVATPAPAIARAAAEADVYILSSLEVDVDLVYDKLEEGCRVHACMSLEPVLTQMLTEEAELRHASPKEKLAEWRRNDQLHCAPICDCDVTDAA